MNRSLAALLFISLAPTPAAGQTLTIPEARQGYFVSLGLQSAGATSKDHDLGRLAPALGGGFSLRVGEMLTDWLGFGLQIETGMVQNDRWQVAYGGLLLATQTNLWRTLGLHLGAGVGFNDATDKSKKVIGSRGTAGAFYSAGVSYDFFPFQNEGSGGWAVTPILQAKYFPGDSFNSTMVSIGIEGVWWSGLDKQQLELSPEEAFVAD